ncbi:MAG: carbamoyltransferase HypF [Ruminococcus sp.]|nr:carbamoyltransferase HypF [Ruminococcus sp.]
MITVNIHVYGIVQGVGFRPFVSVAAERLGVKGTVANKGSYVEIIAQGTEAAVSALTEEIRHRHPERAVVLGLDELPFEGETPSFSGFEIIESEKEYGDIFVSPDIATCDSCRRELFDPSDRRYLHPFINCTQCGPRLTILEAMPYDRVRTTMKGFPMCEACMGEYYSPETRRFDAQPVCCNDCGPELYIIGEDTRGADAIKKVRRSIMAGSIVAVKGIGGFHLCCDAKNSEAVARLRQLKHRPMKPFAVMMRDMDTVNKECTVEPGQEEYLTGWQKPIMLLGKRGEQTISPLIAPDNLTVGVMLPYAPVQMLLFDYPDGLKMTDCLVMTSGNVRGAPICRNDEDAVKEIGSFCDMILSHDRSILIRADDSVCDWLDGKPYMIRRSRGFAPLPIMLAGDRTVQAVSIGGELKNSFCIARNGMLYLSPYVGDMADLRTLKALGESLERMTDMLEAEPQAVVSDTHPMYNTVTFAEEYAREHSLPLVKLQHHYAHILSCMAENNRQEAVIGLSFDGTGYGDDGTIWGGEILLSDWQGYKRLGSVRPFKQVGGDLSAKEGWRIAVQLMRDSFKDAEDICVKLGLCDGQTFRVQAAMADRGLNSVTSTSCGRVFDAVSAILGIRKASTFEGEASTALMYEAERFLNEQGAAQYELKGSTGRTDGYVTLDTTALAADIAAAYLAGTERGLLAYAFHCELAEMLLRACELVREQTGCDTAALSGGVFQNRLLVKLTKERLEREGFSVLLHSLVPPNDGGIALGQAAWAIKNGNNGFEPTV